MADPPPAGGHTGAASVPMTRSRDWTFSVTLFRSSSEASMSTWGATCIRSTPSKWTPPTSAPAVRSSISSNPMGGSESGPFPTTPDQIALCSFGYSCVLLMAASSSPGLARTPGGASYRGSISRFR